MQTEIAVPNLDACLVPGEVADLATEFKRIERVFKDLAIYAEAKRHAMALRLKGEVSMALVFERDADVAYKRLPQWARW